MKPMIVPSVGDSTNSPEGGSSWSAGKSKTRAITMAGAPTKITVATIAPRRAIQKSLNRDSRSTHPYIEAPSPRNTRMAATTSGAIRRALTPMRS